MKCTFCGSEIIRNRGIMLVKNDGSTQNFCSSKCEKNLLMGRNPRKVRWVRKSKKA
ncbi:MAG TPA: 50S ribosomal protein L24e [archaeon]|mgnify:CR=1 FL=1|nr:50S ribosomal protein L24e [archaeon]